MNSVVIELPTPAYKPAEVAMETNSLAGKRVPDELIIDLDGLISAYYDNIPSVEIVDQRVSFGTSGHRGSSLDTRFNEYHILATTQAICDFRSKQGYTGELFLGKDTHALSGPAADTALEVLAANGVEVRYQENGGFTPTPVISNAILTANLNREVKADGIIVTPSHNPPRDGGFKYNPPSGGPASGEITSWIEARANAYLSSGLKGVKRTDLAAAKGLASSKAIDFMTPYIEGLCRVTNMDAIRGAGLRIGADPLGGAGTFYWRAIAEKYGLNLEVVNEFVDPTFSFMRVDRDGKVRMDCSSKWAMAGLIELADQFDIAFGNDPDFDRHGIVTRSSGLLNPNHYLAVSINYLFQNRPLWPASAGIGKTLVSSSMIDRVATSLDRKLVEVPVGFKWFVDGLSTGQLGFGGEESAGASFLTHDGAPWSTDKDGIIMNLLAAEIMAITDKDPGEHYEELTNRFGSPQYARTDAPANRSQKAVLSAMSASNVTATSLAGEPILERLTEATGNDASIGGLKVATENGWFAARPSGTEDIYKIYAESFLGEDHLVRIQTEAQDLVSGLFKTEGV